MEADGQGGGEGAESNNSRGSSLFPLSANPSPPDPTASSGPQWLSNPSFTFDISSLTGSRGGDTLGQELSSSDSEPEASGAAGDPTLTRRPTISEPEPSGSSNGSMKSKKLWLDGFQKLSTVLSPKELSDLQEVMRDKE